MNSLRPLTLPQLAALRRKQGRSTVTISLDSLERLLQELETVSLLAQQSGITSIPDDYQPWA